MSYPDSLEDIPRKRIPHSWADYIELLCLANHDSECSKADILDRVRQPAEDLGEIEDEIEEESPAEENDKWALWAYDCFAHLGFRARAFGNFYPFELSAPGDCLKLRHSLSISQKLYIFFLFASNLRYCGEYTNKLTGSFELMSKAAMAKLLPPIAKAHIFGTSTEEESRFAGPLWDKINKLSEDLCGSVVCTKNNFPQHNTGDGGLDIVGWVPLGDDAPGMPTFFGQCACTENWVEKQHSCGWDAWSQKIYIKTPPTSIIFVPFCFRDARGGWYCDADIHRTVMIDRLRLAWLLQDEAEAFSATRSFPIVEGLLKKKEHIF